VKVTPEEYFAKTTPADLVWVQSNQWFNAIRLLHRINLLREELGTPLSVTSGYRSPEHNKRIGGSPNSNHTQCLAIDIADGNGKLKARLMANNNELLIKFGLYMEDPKDTPSWAHLQIVPPKSGNRVFGR
jgi:hypothetical protein